MTDDNFQKLSLNESFERVAKVAEERAAFNAGIEALTAENFKLAAGSCDVKGGKVGDEHGHFYCTLQKKVKVQAAEIERLRDALEYYAQEMMTGPWGIDSLDFGDVARAALEQSK